jgi:hypothetical protein
MPCCGHNVCWVNPRLPSFCPDCGKNVIHALGASITVRRQAILEIEDEEI